MLASAAIAGAAAALQARFIAIRHIGGIVGTLVSASFLLAIAVMNCMILVAVYRAFRRLRAGHP